MVRRCVLQEVQRFAVKQINERTAVVSANQESVFFFFFNNYYSRRQNLSVLSSSSFSSSLKHPYLYSLTRAARNTSIARSQNASLGNKISEMCVSLLASNTVFSTITKPIKAWMISNESLKTYLLNHMKRMYKQNVAVLLQELEACLESSIYGFVSLDHS